MEIGIFLMPAHPPERSLYDATQWDLDIIELADQLGYVEAWVGEHFTVPWEPICAPDLLSGAGAAADEVDQARARCASACPITTRSNSPTAWPISIISPRVDSCWASAPAAFRATGHLFDVDGKNGEHREMTREALEIMLRIWTEDEPWEHRGKYWNANGIAPMFDGSDEAPHQALPEAAPANRRHRVQRRLRDAQARRRTRLPADEPRSERRIRRQPLGCGAGGRRTQRTHARSPRLATGPRGHSSPRPTSRHSATPSTA